MKRFTETDKWRDPWFLKLAQGAKLAFLYIIENCDNAGVWSADTELADFTIGMKIPWTKALEDFGDRVVVLPSGDWLVAKFINFQFGKLSADCKPHLSVLRLIENHRVSKGYPKGINTLQDKDKDKDKEKKGSPEGGELKPVPPPTAEQVIDDLRPNAAYAGIDLDRELAKMRVWLAGPGKGRKLNRRFIINWLNKAEPMLLDTPPKSPPAGMAVAYDAPRTL